MYRKNSKAISMRPDNRYVYLKLGNLLEEITFIVDVKDEVRI